MTRNTDAKEAVETLGCAAIAAFFVAALIGCVGLGIALGAEWGVAGVAFVIAAVGVLMVLATRNAKRKMENDEEGELKEG